MAVFLEQALLDLGLDAESYRALLILPLVQIAWADGDIAAPEQAELLKAAEHVAVGPEGLRLVRDWVSHRPSDAYFERGQALLRGMAERGESAFDRAALQQVVSLGDKIARSSGGLFGLFAVSREEAEAMRALKTVLATTAADAPGRAPEKRTTRGRGVLKYPTGDLEIPAAGLLIGGVGGGAPAHVPAVGATARIAVEGTRFVLTAIDGEVRVNREVVGERRLLGGERLKVGTFEGSFVLRSP